MCLLSDTDITRILSPDSKGDWSESPARGAWADSQDKLLVHPFNEKFLTPVGFDLTIGSTYISLDEKQLHEELIMGESFTISAGDTISVLTEEYVGMPLSKRVAGIFKSKVSLVMRGLSPISTTLDPDWEGRLLIPITNHRPYPVTLRRGDTFCTMILFSTNSAATKTSNKPAGREDLQKGQMREWLREVKEQEPSRRMQWTPWVAPLVVLGGFTGLGYALFGNNSGFIGMVAGGVALAGIVERTLSKRLGK